MKKYDIKYLPIKHLSEAAKDTTKELDGVIKALGGTYPPPPPPNPKTVVYYQNGTIEELDLNGKIYQSNFPDKSYIIKIELGTKVTEIAESFSYDAFESLEEIIIPKTVISIGSDSLFFYRSTNIYTFLERTKADVQAMTNYPFGAGPHDGHAGNTFRCTDGDLIPT